MIDTKGMTPREVRALIREEKITTHTSGMCPGYAQANLVILPKNLAYDFLLFTQRNPKPCPILEVGDVGSKNLPFIADGCDITTDIPRYRVYEKGVLTGEYNNVSKFWRDDLVSFLIGCSFSFESELIDADIEIRHNTMGRNVPMYITNIETTPAGIFHGPTTVSMRPIPYDQVVRAVTVTGAMPRVHGTPLHIGDPAAIGIKDINKPDFGDPVEIKDGEVPVFWACGVTPQSVLMAVKPDFVITHAPGYMLLTDIKNADLKNN